MLTAIGDGAIAMRRRAKPKKSVPPLQQAEFDALPDSVQRKYFSSLEKLQIRQASADQHGSEHSVSSRADSSTPLCPSVTPGTRRNPKPDHPPHSPAVSQQELDFFFSLPEKLRKVHYSREEQAVLLGRCEQAFLAFDYDDHLERAQQRFSDFHFGFQRDPYHTCDAPRQPSPAPLPAPLPALSPAPSLKSIASWSVTPSRSFFSPSAQEKEDAESSLFYLDIMSPTSSKRPTPQSAVRRTMSLTSTSMQYSSSSAVLVGHPVGFTSAPRPSVHQRAHSSSLSGRRSLQTPTPPLFDPEATHYSDPEARKKLRTYLASPQKFDEAIEFGFPSTAGEDSVAPHFQLPPITSHSRKFSRDMHTFLREGKLSFFEDIARDNQGLESDDDSVPDVESPTTPSSTGQSFRVHTRQISHSKLCNDDLSGLSPLHTSTGHFNREMTLRMTLTRPDLRADEDQLYGWQATSPKVPRDDPLALEDLVFSDDVTGTKGAFYVKPKPRGNLVTRMLKRASLKGR
ncbi:hypothetical protein HBI56_091890 [Parastagonospora nodorum]|uniref:Uncharacterized protein n=2 Tax=Phaeosphaeria nodorum (strain SN15 / ATCC MYA-4574 / FGSC 10173) TaxID=321614 RepID=A0A7U2I138_PHANO|nr:hypothetical protein SNOG_16541 [Parastagonospora nodorum SN15]KAH3914280.1 hypothetical protein HBH56_086980 [Parastagonospora nodorum]EAT76081.2 hypothetical protein SNOG_16541 [Parastagonospora nodorum SN15]KAH3921197.1 hypothetical protein HBH54_243800 [Parastagonospora nodorum]KAH3945694.1 hypothetical protein HBH53_139040 [Parastagonospora nodorum]KAH3956748.1 hypothetical protein HBH51_236280 [Parastagonospora nodorum]